MSKKDNYLQSASANEMTGLTPTAARNEDEAQNYEEVFPYLPPVQHNPNGIGIANMVDLIPPNTLSHITKKKKP